jgi:hypothetical protein
MRPISLGVVPFALALALASASEARADGCRANPSLTTCIDDDNLWFHPGAGPFVALGTTNTTPASTVSFGLALSYLSRPIGLRVASPDPAGTKIYVVDNALDATLLAAIGVTDRLELTLAAPFTLAQSGAGIADVVGNDEQLPRSAIHDLRFGFAYGLIPRARTGEPRGFSLLGRFDLALPTSSPGSFNGYNWATFAPSVTASWRLIPRLELTGEAGARIRPETTFANVNIGTQIFGGLGAAFDVIPTRHLLTVGAEAMVLGTLAHQGPPVRDQPAERGPALIPAEWMVSVSSAPLLAGDASVTLAGGGPIPFSSEAPVTNPRFRFDLALRYAPTGHDRDADGVLDRDDKCPDVAEDRDGFEDQDGCPDPDNDKDGIPDSVDKCRDKAEDFDGFQDKDGCPDLDDDNDGIPDADDKCRNEAEDRDGVQDKDGCPDLDDDGDGIPDAQDACKNDPEDKDGFQDRDGCPEPDNDRDGLLDAQDKCPNEPEDKDGFEDADGCPDPDNDQDGILDAKDRCPTQAETIDGVQDEDGCPEPNAKSLVHWSDKGDKVFADKPARFAAGKAPGNAKITAPIEAQLKQLAQLLRGRGPYDLILVEAYGKTPALGADRAAAIKSVLAANGLPADRITAAAADGVESPAKPPYEISVQRARPARPSKGR